MSSLFSKEEELECSPIIVGHTILATLRSRASERISIFDLAEAFEKHAWYTPKRLYFGLIFLYSINAVSFTPPYVECHA
jgi:hypothetical protein